jgi:hypothetical protein
MSTAARQRSEIAAWLAMLEDFFRMLDHWASIVVGGLARAVESVRGVPDAAASRCPD